MEEFPVDDENTDGEYVSVAPLDIVAEQQRLRKISEMILEARAFYERVSKPYLD